MQRRSATPTASSLSRMWIRAGSIPTRRPVRLGGCARRARHSVLSALPIICATMTMVPGFSVEEGSAFLAAAADTNLILSLACVPHHMPVVERIAERYPIPILCHHMARVRADAPGRTGIAEILAVARRPNVYVKISGFGYAAGPGEVFPYPEQAWVVRCLYEFFGPERLCWGSDYPVVRRFMTYAQSLDVSPAPLCLHAGGRT